MKLYLDTEFTELSSNAHLLSIAIIDEENRLFYAEIVYPKDLIVSDWIRENVITHFFLTDGVSGNEKSTFVKAHIEEVKKELTRWLSYYEKTTCRFVADVYMYDWVLFADLFGGALNLPRFIHFIPIDFASILFCKNFDPNVKRSDLVEVSEVKKMFDYNFELTAHNALFDAMMLKKCFEKLMNT